MAGLVCPAGHAFDADDGARRFCPVCGMPLTPVGDPPVLSDAGRRARKVSPQYGEGRLVKVGWARNQAEAELIAGMLLEEGVPAVIKRGLGVDVPDLIAAGPRDILVAESGADVARAVLAPVEDRPPVPRGARPLWVRALAVMIAVALLLVAIVGAAAGTAGLRADDGARVNCDAWLVQKLDGSSCPR